MVKVKDKRISSFSEHEDEQRRERSEVEGGTPDSPLPSDMATSTQASSSVLAPPPIDPVTSLINKVFALVVNQPEFYEILAQPRPVRRRLERELAKVMTTFPHFKKVGAMKDAQAEHEELSSPSDGGVVVG